MDKPSKLGPHAKLICGSIGVAKGFFPRPDGQRWYGRNEMDPPLCGSTSMSHNEFTTREPIEPQEASPRKQEMSVLGIDSAKRVFHAIGMDNTGKIVFRKRFSRHDLMPW